jgi:hypothetical protein
MLSSVPGAMTMVGVACGVRVGAVGATVNGEALPFSDAWTKPVPTGKSAPPELQRKSRANVNSMHCPALLK